MESDVVYGRLLNTMKKEHVDLELDAVQTRRREEYKDKEQILEHVAQNLED